MNIGLSYEHRLINKRMLALENQLDERTQDWLVQKFGFRQFHKLDAIQAEPPNLLHSRRLKGALFAGCQRDGTMREACIRRLFVELCDSSSVFFCGAVEVICRIVLRFLSKPCVCQSPFGASDVNTYLISQMYPNEGKMLSGSKQWQW